MTALLLELLLAGAIAVLMTYVLFGTGREIWVGDIDRHAPLDWNTLGPWLRGSGQKLGDREGRWGREHRRTLGVAIAALPLLGGMLASAVTGSFPGIALVFSAFGALPRLYYTGPRTSYRELDAMLPAIIVDLRALIADDSMEKAQAFLSAISTGESPMYERLRVDLGRLGVGYSFERALLRAAEAYRRPLFFELAQLLAEHKGRPSALDAPLASFEQRLLDDYSSGVQDAINTRNNLVLLVGVAGLLPALGILAVYPLIAQFFRQF